MKNMNPLMPPLTTIKMDTHKEILESIIITAMII
jgi:hypothetical protein